MQIEHHTVLNAISRAIILCDSDTEQAKDGLYALGDYLKHYFFATTRRQSEPDADELERVAESLRALRVFLGKDPA
jgi:hypothetical protein